MKYFLCYVLLCEIEDVLIRVFNLIVQRLGVVFGGGLFILFILLVVVVFFLGVDVGGKV